MSEAVVIALIGVTGAVIGSISTIALQWVKHYLQERSVTQRDKPRKDLLLEMLNNPKYNWRELATLMHVIGSDEETTKRLLLEVGARASEDGKPIWGLIKRNPLPNKSA